MVIIDQTLAFFGGMQLDVCCKPFCLLKTGIDLYFGRWDTNYHRLTDVGRPAVGPPLGLPITYVCIYTDVSLYLLMYVLQEDQVDSPDAYQKHVGKDYGNTFIKGAPDPDKPFEGQYNQKSVIKSVMNWVRSYHTINNA